LKRVYLEGENLYVANYLKWVRISLTEVDGIGASWWNGERGKQPRITLTLKASSEFGDRIVFSPRGLRLKKAADELRQLIEERTNRQIASWQNEYAADATAALLFLFGLVLMRVYRYFYIWSIAQAKRR
jgi:hypothetical protein